MRQNPTDWSAWSAALLCRRLWVSLGDFIANIPATHRPGNRCQGLASAAPDLIAQQAPDHRAYTDANRAIAGNWRWRWRRLL
jgi:hypothetical protein